MCCNCDSHYAPSHGAEKRRKKIKNCPKVIYLRVRMLNEILSTRMPEVLKTKTLLSSVKLSLENSAEAISANYLLSVI